MQAKAQRHETLLRLVRLHRLGRQEEIVRWMAKAGFPVTQASVSRDIRELGLVKIDGRYVPLENLAADAPPDVPAGAAGLVTAVDSAGANLLVIRTTPGAASTVAIAVDNHRLAGVAGTIAGDDTVFVAVRGRAAIEKVARTLRGWVRPAKAG